MTLDEPIAELPTSRPSSELQQRTIRADVAIIGAGPAGLAAAIHLGQIGVGPVVLCDRADFPRDKTCGSAISPKGIEVLAALDVKETVLARSYQISGMRLVTPRRHELVLSGHTDVAAICCRRVFDHLLLERAQETGSIFLPRFQASYLLQKGDTVAGVRSSDGREIQAGYTIVADGAHSRLTPERGPRRMIQAIMGWWDGVPFAPHHVEMIFDDLVTPLYGWLFPESETRVNIGICYEDPGRTQNARHLFAAFLDKQYGARLRDARQVGALQGHPISYSTKIGKLASPGRIVIGEAGRMTHPATAEGIYQAMRSGMLAAEALHGILKRGQEPAHAFRRYESACRKAFGASFLGALAWRRFVSLGGLDALVGAAKRPMAQRLLARGMARM